MAFVVISTTNMIETGVVVHVFPRLAQGIGLLAASAKEGMSSV